MARRALAFLLLSSLTGRAATGGEDFLADAEATEAGVQWLEQSARRRVPTPPPYDSRRRAPTPPPDVRRRAPSPPPDDRRRAPRPTPTPTPTPSPTDIRRRGSPTPSPPTPSPSPRRRNVPPQPVPSPNPPPGDTRRRGELRRRGGSDPLPSDCCGSSATRRRIDNSDRTDSLRRRNDVRRRSNDGWYSTDYSRRRGISGSTVALAAGLGFAGGIALGAMISQPGGNSFYYHQMGWYDMNHVFHQPGYYSPTGYYYPNAAAVGYCPPSGAPDFSAAGGANCGVAHHSHIWMWILGCCCGCCICAIIVGYCWNQQKARRESGLETELNRSFQSEGAGYGDPITRQGQQVPRADAVAFLQAVEAEYCYSAQGEVGRVFDSRQILQEVQSRLDCEEEAIREAGNPRAAVNMLANRWGMTNQLNGS